MDFTSYPRAILINGSSAEIGLRNVPCASSEPHMPHDTQTGFCVGRPMANGGPSDVAGPMRALLEVSDLDDEDAICSTLVTQGLHAAVFYNGRPGGASTSVTPVASEPAANAVDGRAWLCIDVLTGERLADPSAADATEAESVE